ncbi:MAG TPA: hypothetical protein ENF94_00790 [Candidatus Woesearchaeota archaeon]|nr:MAG: hypothetical protein DRJ25_01305 [Candidatus Woesearchaeota archaeon]HDD70677.1 hypothetical protein [Candidatus Woesearchaeota archaeon]
MLENYWDKVKRYFWFSKAELNGFVLTALVFAFIYSFDKWGVVEFDFLVGLRNFFLAVLLCGSALFVHHAGQRLMAIKIGMKAEHKVWWPGLVVALIMVLLSGGKVGIYAASAVFISLLPQHRLGGFRYEVNVGSLAKVAIAGPLFNVFLATGVVLLKWFGVLPAFISDPVFTFNVYFVAWNLLPIPPLDGSRVIFHSRLIYIFFVSSILAYILLIFLFEWYSYITALIIGVVCWFLFYVFFERK